MRVLFAAEPLLATVQSAQQTDTVARAMPFRAGEKFTYDASFGIIRVGRGTIELTGSIRSARDSPGVRLSR
jgi:hypothetical protein